jgi:thiamine biosynthesis lipoprotein
MEINLGAIGKGFALDRCAEVLDARGVQDYLIHAGQSSILARGSRSAGKGSGWSVAVRHPLKPTVRLAELRLFDRALGTSGSGNQFFYFQGTRYGHVLDPRTGSSVEGILSATVLAPNAAQADALSTAFFVLGVDQVRQFCQNHPDISAILVCPGHRKGSLVIHVIQLKDDEWRSLGRVAGREWQIASGR